VDTVWVLGAFYGHVQKGIGVLQQFPVYDQLCVFSTNQQSTSKAEVNKIPHFGSEGEAHLLLNILEDSDNNMFLGLLKYHNANISKKLV